MKGSFSVLLKGEFASFLLKKPLQNSTFYRRRVQLRLTATDYVLATCTIPFAVLAALLLIAATTRQQSTYAARAANGCEASSGGNTVIPMDGEHAV